MQCTAATLSEFAANPRWLGGIGAFTLVLARYTHRTAIGNERLLGIAGDKLLMRVRADATGGKRTVFMRRVAAIEIERCPHCRLGHWRVVEQRGADRAAIAAPTLAVCRGPP